MALNDKQAQTKERLRNETSRSSNKTQQTGSGGEIEDAGVAGSHRELHVDIVNHNVSACMIAMV